MVEKRKSVIAKVVINILVNAVYAFSLSVLVPLMLMVFFPEQLWPNVFYAKPVIFLAVGLVFLSMGLLYIYTGSAGKTFFRLGLVTFLPGFLALVFSFYSKEIVFGMIEKYIGPFYLVEPYLGSYFEMVLPKVLTLAIAYLALGVFLIYIGVSYLRAESTRSWVKQVFGPRARIISR